MNVCLVVVLLAPHTPENRLLKVLHSIKNERQNVLNRPFDLIFTRGSYEKNTKNVKGRRKGVT